MITKIKVGEKVVEFKDMFEAVEFAINSGMTRFKISVHGGLYQDGMTFIKNMREFFAPVES